MNETGEKMNNKIVAAIITALVLAYGGYEWYSPEEPIYHGAPAFQKEWDATNKTLIIKPLSGVTYLTIQQISYSPDLCTCEEVFNITSYVNYEIDTLKDFKVGWQKYKGKHNITSKEWYIQKKESYNISVPKYGEVQNNKVIPNIVSYNNITEIGRRMHLGKECTIGRRTSLQKWNVTHTTVNGTETSIICFDIYKVLQHSPLKIRVHWNETRIIGMHNVTRHRLVWKEFSHIGKTLQKNKSYIVKLVLHKKPELGSVSIKILPMFMGFEERNLTWWNTSWSNKREIKINNTGGSALTYYPVFVNLTDTPINETSLRVVNETADATVPHWCENETGGNCTMMWFNNTGIPTSAWQNDTYYIYYNEPSVSSASDGTNTFEFFDDFEVVEEWEKYSGNPVLNSSSGSERFDSGYIYDPLVLKVDSEYWMYYCGGLAPNVNKRDNIGLAISTDLNNWTRWDGDQTNQSIVYSGGVGDFDEDRAWMHGTIIRENATSWKMWYVGDSDMSGAHIGRVGYATSTNGKNWTKYSGSGYGNSIFQDMSTSAKGIAGFFIVKDGASDYKMIYCSFGPAYEGTDIRYATSTDGINWTIQNSGTPVISGDYTVSNMINISGTYYLWVFPTALTTTKLFTSTDLINWTDKGTQIYIGGTGEWDSVVLYWSRVFENTSGVWRMFFNAHDSVNICIGYATLEKTLPIITSQWTTIGSPVDYISTNDYWSGTRSMQIGVTNDGGIVQGTLAASEDIAISMRLKTTTSDYFLVLHGDSSTNINIVFMTDLLQYYDAGWVGTHSAPHGNWYKLTMKDIDYTANTYDICLGDDETVIYDSVNMHSSGDYNGIIKMYNGNEPGIGYVDNFYARKYSSPEPSTTLGSEEAPSNNPITITGGNRALFCNWSSNTTLSSIAANLTNCTDFFAYNSTSQRWTFYNVNRTINADTVIHKHAAIFVCFNNTTTVECNILAAETITIPSNVWYYTALRESTSKTLTEINTAITTDGCTITDSYAWNSAAGAYTNTGSYSVLPNEGFAIYCSVGCNWDGGV